MGNKGLQRLAILLTKNADPNWVNDDLYKLLWYEELYHMATNRRKPSFSVASDTEGTAMMDPLDQQVATIIGELREQRFQLIHPEDTLHPKIPKREDLVGEVLGIILQAVYDSPKGPTFKNTAFGWRFQQGRHAALRSLSSWKDVQWFIEGSVAGRVTRQQQHTLGVLLQQRIRDGRFLDLVWKLLAVRPLDFSTAEVNSFTTTLLGIYLHALDCFIETLQTTYGSLHFVRHSHEWRIGICGNKQMADEVASQVADFLQQNLIITPSALVQPAHSGTLFLGCLAKTRQTTNHRTTRLIELNAPINQILKRLALQGICDKSGQPQPKTAWIYRDLSEIVGRFHRINQGYLDYYCFARNRRQLRQVQYILQQSAARTLAQKLKLSVRKVFQQFGPELAVTPHTTLALNQDWRQQPRCFHLGNDEPSPHPKWIPLEGPPLPH